ncbi:MAG: glycosyltransferase family 39 protein [Patescibacteria group bacterium]|nr:glycosyltransferase family 39 protein [Patescibacteria group bacterium]
MIPAVREQGPRFRAAVFWLAYAVVGFIIFWQHDVSSDSGVVLTGAWQISEGQVLYRDFVQFYPPGTFYLLAAFFKLFGVSYAVARGVGVGLILFSGFGLWIAVRNFLPRWRSYVAPVFFLVAFAFYPSINHNPWSLCVAVWAWVVLQWALRRKRTVGYLFAGVLCGAVVWMLHTKGLAVFSAGVVVLWQVYRQSWRSVAWYAAGFILALIPALIFWPASTLWQDLFVLPFRYNRLPLVGTNYVFFFLALGLVMLVGWLLWRKQAGPAVMAWWWLSLALMASSIIRPDSYHIILNSFPIMPLVLWLSYPGKLGSGWKPIPFDLILWSLPAVYLATVAAVLLWSFPSYLPWWSGRSFSQWLRLENPELRQLVSLVQARVPANAPIYAGPFLPNAYFEMQRRNATSFDQLITTLHPPEFFTAARRQLEANPPALAILNYQPVEKYGHRQDNPVDEYIQAHYREFERRGPIIFMEPIP